jgi:branched-chain amino acid transport system substrate-binding protein
MKKITFKQIMFILIMTLVVSAMLTSCASPSSPTTEESGDTTGAASQIEMVGWENCETLRFAVSLPMTGTTSDFGVGGREGMELALEEINNSGGIAGKPVTLDYYDDQSDPKQSANIAQRVVDDFAKDKCLVSVIGPIMSTNTLTMMPLTEKAKLPLFTPQSSSPKLVEQGYKYFIRSTTNANVAGPLMAAYAVKEMGANRVAMIYANNDYGVGLMETAKAELEELGVELVANEAFSPVTDTDFRAQLTKINATNPDVLMIMGEYTEGGLIVKQAKDIDMTTEILGCSGLQNPSYLNIAGEAAEGTYIFTYYDANDQTPANVEFVKKYTEKYSKEPIEQSAYFYSALYFFKQAIEEGGATRENLMDVLKSQSVLTPQGTLTWDEKGDVYGANLYIQIVKDGKFTTYASFSG